MTTLDDVMAALKAKGSAQTRKTYARHGVSIDMDGVRIADLKVIAKAIKGRQDLALELFDTGHYDAMYLAGLVADGAKMSKARLESWAKHATAAPIAEYTVPWVAVESRHARALALKWIGSKRESIATTGWNTYAGLLATSPDEKLALDEIRLLLNRVVAEIDAAPNKVRYTMNGFVIAVGGSVRPLLNEAKAAAKKIGVVTVDMGDTSCKVPRATDYIAKMEQSGVVGRKRKSMKC